jgi:hypothetical protein
MLVYTYLTRVFDVAVTGNLGFVLITGCKRQSTGYGMDGPWKQQVLLFGWRVQIGSLDLEVFQRLSSAARGVDHEPDWSARAVHL